MHVLILRPYRKDYIYFRTIEEREKITGCLPYCHLLNMKTNIGPVSRSWVSSQVLKCYNCFLHAFTSTLHTLFHSMLKMQCSAFIALLGNKMFSSFANNYMGFSSFANNYMGQ